MMIVVRKTMSAINEKHCLTYLVLGLEILSHISKTIRSMESLEGLSIEKSTFLVVGVDDCAADGSNLIQP